MRARALLVAFAVLLAGCGTLTPYAAKVNGERITVRDLERELKAIRGNEQYLEAVESQLAAQGRKALGAGKGTFDSSFVSQVLTRRILLELVLQEVRKKRLRITADDRRVAREQLEQSFGDPQMLGRFPKRFVDELVTFTAAVSVLQGSLREPVTDADVQKFYDENPAFFEQACFREAVTGNFESIEVPPDQDAKAKAEGDEIKRRVDAGEDFAAIGQDRGCQPVESLPPTLRPALSEMQPGEVRGPIRSDTGYHVVQLLERKKQPLEEAAPQIRQFLERQGQGAFDRFVQEAVEKADITVNPRYGTFDKAGPAVVPPQAPSTSSTSTSAPVPAEQ
ncbi:MAG TPA: peptidyl-prolyl cis-trans isomerase [Acidimicrobiales bacterium]|nr:peptidyl-prolyl cis-trans isomerase [Acidimicrobiales bacterium]